jgi:phage head maturation protease
MLVARRKEALEAVAAECKAILLLSPSKPASFDGRQVIMRVKEEVDRKVLVHVGSLNDVDSMLEARETVKRGTWLPLSQLN